MRHKGYRINSKGLAYFGQFDGLGSLMVEYVIILKKIIKLAKLFTTYLLVLLNKYKGVKNIPKVTSKIYLGITTISAN